jgi:hypothetical protein
MGCCGRKPFAALALRAVRREILPIYVYVSSSYAEMLSYEPVPPPLIAATWPTHETLLGLTINGVGVI